MLENSLHALQRPVETKEHPHEAAIMTDSMGQRWGTNKTLTATTGEGHAFVFIAVVHCPGELVDTHASSTVPLYARDCGVLRCTGLGLPMGWQLPQETQLVPS